jgi:hypothetical protein
MLQKPKEQYFVFITNEIHELTVNEREIEEI